MSKFEKYMHLEHYGNDHVEGLLDGEVYVQPKLDGTNASVWLDNDTIKFGSRNRDLTGSDNQGFVQALVNCQDSMKELEFFFAKYPNYTLYGEWLVPHTFKEYKKTAWNKFYIFDVYDHSTNQYLDFRGIYDELTEAFFNSPTIRVVPTRTLFKPSYAQLILAANSENYQCDDNVKCGEGIVVKRPDHISKRSFEQVYLKIIAAPYRAQRVEAGYVVAIESNEEALVNKFATSHFLQKEYAKELSVGLNIARFIGNSYYTFVHEHIWDMIKKTPSSVINFRQLNKCYITKLKAEFPDVFKKGGAA